MKSFKIPHHPGNDANVFSDVGTEIESLRNNRVTGPASATDNAVVRFDATTGKLVQDSVVTISDTGVVAGVPSIELNHASANTLSAAGGHLSIEGVAVWDQGNVGTQIAALTEDTPPVAPTAYVVTSDGLKALISALGGRALVASGTVTNAATLDIVLTGYTGYRGIVIELYGFLPATDNVDLWMRFSSNGGSTFDASGYNYSLHQDAEGTDGTAGSGSANQIAFSSAAGSFLIGNAATAGINLTVKMMNQTSAAFWSRVTWQGYYITSTGASSAGFHTVGGGSREAAQDTDAVRFLFSSGNIAAGAYAVYVLA